MNNKTRLWLILILFPCFLFSQNPGSHTGPILELGSVLPLTGPMGAFGQQWRRGMEVFLKYYHAEKKTGGKEIQIIFADDGFKPEKTLQQVRNLTENKKVFALVGSLGSPASQNIMDYVVAAAIPWIAPGSGSMLFNQPPRRNIFPLQPSFFYEGRVMVRFAAEALKKGRMAVIYQNDELGRSALEGVKSLYAERGRRYGLLLDAVPVNIKDRDFSAVAGRIAASNPESVAVFGFGKTAADILTALKRAGILSGNTALLTTYINADPFVFQMGEPSLWEGVYTASWIKPYSKDFLKIWKKYSGTETPPSVYEASGWAAMELFAEGLIRALSKNPAELDWRSYQAALESFKEDQFNEGLSFRVAYSRYYSKNPFCRSPQVGLYFMKAEKGRYVPVPVENGEEGFYLTAY